jgi:DMSO/TMAO reductase YedYZ molybdopterin-dependent catalytic subunit
LLEGWSAIAKWTGVWLGTVLELAEVHPTARYVVLRCADIMEESDEPY